MLCSLIICLERTPYSVPSNFIALFFVTGTGHIVRLVVVLTIAVTGPNSTAVRLDECNFSYRASIGSGYFALSPVYNSMLAISYGSGILVAEYDSTPTRTSAETQLPAEGK